MMLSYSAVKYIGLRLQDLKVWFSLIATHKFKGATAFSRPSGRVKNLGVGKLPVPTMFENRLKGLV